MLLRCDGFDHSFTIIFAKLLYFSIPIFKATPEIRKFTSNKDYQVHESVMYFFISYASIKHECTKAVGIMIHSIIENNS